MTSQKTCTLLFSRQNFRNSNEFCLIIFCTRVLLDPAMVNASNLAHTCKRGTKPWCPLPTAIEVRNGYVYAKPTMVKSYGMQTFLL